MTIFPNLKITAIEVETEEREQYTRFDEPIYGESDGERLLPGMVESVGKKVSNLVKRLNPTAEEEIKIIYFMDVEAISPRVAHGKARSFVRAKNPFEPDIIDVEVHRASSHKENTVSPLKLYEVQVEVQK